jgi:AMP phosphorylase (EC 2.4.2.-)
VGITTKRTFRVKSIDVKFPQPIVIINEDDARELGIASGNVVLATIGDVYHSLIVMTSKTLAQRSECVFPLELMSKLGISEGDVIGLRLIGLPQSIYALKKRLKGEKLTEGEFLALIRDVVAGMYGEAEIAAFLVSQLYNPLSDSELSHLIKAMVETGVKVKFEETVYDIHSIGGVPGNSKVALISVPIVAAAGLLIPKTSSRAITSPAGTADTMEVLASVDLAVDEIVEIARKVKGTLAWGGRLNLAPADDIFVSIERKLAIDPEQQWLQVFYPRS